MERLLLWISNCVQLLLFLKHSFHLENQTGVVEHEDGRSNVKEDCAQHSLAQLITGLEEIIMYCFKQCVYTITKVLFLSP